MSSALRIAAALLAFMSCAVAQETLELVREAKCEALFRAPGPYDASGVTFVDGKLFVVFDTKQSIGIVDLALESGRLSDASPGTSDFEGISYDAKRECFYVVIEALRGATGYHGGLVAFNKKLEITNRWILDPPVGGPSKGFEGVLAIRRGKHEFVLALLESNHGVAKMNPKAQDRGNGRVRVYQRGQAEGETTWTLVTTLELPKTAEFEDYAGIDLRGKRLVVVSQSTRRLWVGTLNSKRWTVDAGTVYKFPKTDTERYGNVEGVAWVSDREVAVVSDGAKGKVRNLAKAESVHVFRIPK